MQIYSNMNLNHFHNNSSISVNSNQPNNINLKVEPTSEVENTKVNEETIIEVKNLTDELPIVQPQSSFLNNFSSLDTLTLLQNNKVSEPTIQNTDEPLNTNSYDEWFEDNDIVVSDSTTEAFTIEEIISSNISTQSSSSTNDIKTKNAMEAYTAIDNIDKTDWESIFSDFSNGDGLII